MLYVTTRSRKEQYPALRTLGQNRAPDGGLYVPFRLPEYGAAAVAELKEQPFGACVAEVLNRLFSLRMNGADVDYTLGRAPVKLVSMNHRIHVAEMWHNPQWRFDWAVSTLTRKMQSQSQISVGVTEWAQIAVRIGILFAVFGELEKGGTLSENSTVDVAVNSGDFTRPMAVWYAREMGLPIGTIICGCSENGAPWDLLHRGELRTNETAISNDVGDAWAVPRGLERLIAGCLGTEEAERYCQVCRRGGIYAPNPEQREALQRGMFAAVISRRRMERVISSVYRTHAYVLDPCASLAYAGLQDYRAMSGTGSMTLLLAEESPAGSAGVVSAALGMTVQALHECLEQA